MFDTILTTFEPHIVGLVSLVLTTIFALVGRALMRVLGLQAERIWREALHSAIDSGALQVDATGAGGSLEDLVPQVVDYARRSVPDAIEALGARPDVLVGLARAKIQKLRGTGQSGNGA
jgi:hypothetical protein